MSADARAARNHLWHTAGGDPAALARVTLTGADALLPTDFKIGAAASAAVAATSLAAAELWGLRTGRTQDVGVEEMPDLLAESDSPFGRLCHAVLAGRLSETPAFWARPSVARGTHEPVRPA